MRLTFKAESGPLANNRSVEVILFPIGWNHYSALWRWGYVSSRREHRAVKLWCVEVRREWPIIGGIDTRTHEEQMKFDSEQKPEEVRFNAYIAATQRSHEAFCTVLGGVFAWLAFAVFGPVAGVTCVAGQFAAFLYQRRKEHEVERAYWDGLRRPLQTADVA